MCIVLVVLWYLPINSVGFVVFTLVDSVVGLGSIKLGWLVVALFLCCVFCVWLVCYCLLVFCLGICVKLCLLVILCLGFVVICLD